MASRYSSYINTSSLDSRSSTKSSSSKALNKSSLTNTKTSNLSSMMKKLIETKSHAASSSKNMDFTNTQVVKKLQVNVDFVAEDLKKNGVNKGGGFSNIQKKLFKGLKGKKEGEKALMDVKNHNGNTRTLAMVLRSERELLCANREQEEEIIELKLLLEEKNREAEKLMDLCLKQREEIKNLKNSILFPDVNVMDSHIKGVMEKQSSELSQANAKQFIPSLQRQVTSLTGQLQCLAEDLAEVKADKIYPAKGSCEASERSPMSQGYYINEAANSLEFSTTPGSPDDSFLKDLNPCLTPYVAKTMSKEFEVHDSTEDEWLLSRYDMQMGDQVNFCSCNQQVLKSLDCCHCAKARNCSYNATYRSHESKCTVRNRIHNKLF